MSVMASPGMVDSGHWHQWIGIQRANSMATICIWIFSYPAVMGRIRLCWNKIMFRVINTKKEVKLSFGLSELVRQTDTVFTTCKLLIEAMQNDRGIKKDPSTGDLQYHAVKHIQSLLFAECLLIQHHDPVMALKLFQCYKMYPISVIWVYKPYPKMWSEHCRNKFVKYAILSFGHDFSGRNVWSLDYTFLSKNSWPKLRNGIFHKFIPTALRLHF